MRWGLIRLTSGIAAPILGSLLLTACGGGGSSDGGGGTAPPPPPPPPAFTVTEIDLPVNRMIWDDQRQLMYLSIPISADLHPQTITALDPLRLETTDVATPGYWPDFMALSDDGQYLYVGNDTPNDDGVALSRFLLPSWQLDFSIDVGEDLDHGLLTPVFIEVAPGQPNTIALSRIQPTSTPQAIGGVAIYDGAVQRRDVAAFYANPVPIDSIVWGGDTGTIYGYDDESSEHAMSFISADADGAHLTTTNNALVTGNEALYAHIQYLGGLVYVDSGDIIDPVAQQVVGTFPLPEGRLYPVRMALDAELNRAFFIYSTGSGLKIDSYNLTTHASLASIDVPQCCQGGVVSFIRWGDDGLAYSTADTSAVPAVGKIYLVRGTFVKP